MEQLEAFFQGNSALARRKIFVVHGLGGMGKTQLCVEYARKHKDAFSAVLWLDGSSKDALRQSLADAALRLPKGPGTAAARSTQATDDLAGSIDVLLRWLSQPDNTRWLLILDNVDRDWQLPQKDPQAYDFHDFLPPNDYGNVLITTRLARLQRPKASLYLDDVGDRVGREILETRARKHLQSTWIAVDRGVLLQASPANVS